MPSPVAPTRRRGSAREEPRYKVERRALARVLAGGRVLMFDVVLGLALATALIALSAALAVADPIGPRE